jgi:O-antigen ligase
VRVVSLGLAGATGIHEPTRSVRVNPLRVFQVAIALLVVGNLGRIPVLDLGDRAAPLLVNDIAIMSVVAIGALAMVHRRELRLNDVAIAGIVFVSIGALSAIAGLQRFGFSGLELLASLAYLARWTMYFAVYVVAINVIRARDAERVWTVLERVLLVMVAFGVVQAIFLPNFAFMVYPDARESYDWDSQRNRLVSTVLEPNIMAGMILTILLVQLARLSAGVRVAAWKPGLLFGGLVMTLSRGGMLSFAVGAAAIVVMHGLSKRLWKFAALIGLAALVALPKLIWFANQYRRLTISDESAMARLMMWQRAFATFLDHPWFGIGFNTYGFVQERRGFMRIGGAAYSVEGGLLFIAVMTGIVGLLVYMALLWFVLRRTRRAWKIPIATPAERGLLVGTAAATIAVLVNSLFVNSLLTPWVMEPLWILWALAFVVAVDLKRRHAGLPEPA